MVGFSNYPDKAGKGKEIKFFLNKQVQHASDSLIGNSLKPKIDQNRLARSIKGSYMRIGNSSMNRHPFKPNPDDKRNTAHF